MTKREVILEWLQSEHRKSKKMALRAIAYFEVRFDAEDDVEDALEQVYITETMLQKSMIDEDWIQYMRDFGFIDPRAEMHGLDSQDDVDELIREVDMAMKRPTLIIRNNKAIQTEPRANLRSVK